ncbi:unnamed protein product [Adineta ricciae]|uniref:Nuclear receptor domain-containing protein n=1 Tax=Adineta ricciae TaxID=249248 RepID=A0A816EHA8_ADIRI|nr:unnamed protein product [Adineta ricciae]CAF1652755.1 unnamed protein product [Adineta ricciae]
MAKQTKMIFITSNEDLVHQIASKQVEDTHIIDLDDPKQVTSMINNNSINWTFLAGLSELDSKNDQIYKRALDSHQDDQEKQRKLLRKSIDLICKICGDRAIGFNYDVLSCSSCKAFFHRYAHQDLKKLKCSSRNQNQCKIVNGERSKCHRCRLNRCFAMGMRTDFILSQEEIQRRKGFEKNPNISSTNSTCISQTFNNNDKNIFSESLTAEDLIVIDTIQSDFLSIFQNQFEGSKELIDLTDRVSALISWSESHNKLALLIIKYCRLINEFENLNADDRFILIKYNLLSLFSVILCYNCKSRNQSSSSYQEYDGVENKRQFYSVCDPSSDMYTKVINLMISSMETLNQDLVLVSLLTIILLFSKGLSMNENEPLLNDSLSVYRAQSYYTKILWNYLIDKQGEMKTYKQFTRMLTEIFQRQTCATIFREFINIQIKASQTIDQITPLIQTVLHIS